MIKYIYIILGLITLALGLLGIVTPGLPTTPFILLTAFFFAKGSSRLHKMLIENKVTGKYIRRVNSGFNPKEMVISIAIMWIMICFSTFVIFKNHQTMQYLMFGLGLIGTVSQILVLRKKKKKQTIEESLQNTDHQN